MSSETPCRRLRLARLLIAGAPPIATARLIHVLYPYELARRARQQFAVRTITGSPFIGNTADFHAHPVAVRGYGEWRNIAVALAVCRSGDVIVEVGANVGTETVAYSDIVGDGGAVVAFEPSPGNQDAIATVCTQLRRPNVTVMPCALSNRSGTAKFAVPPPTMSQGTAHLLGAEEQRSGQTTYYYRPVPMGLIDVELRTLDEVADDIDRVALLAADVEGAELALLQGGRRVLATNRPVLLLEASNPHLRRSGHAGVEDLHEELVAQGYRSYEIGRFRLKAVTSAPVEPTYSRNWLCVPSERRDVLPAAQRLLRQCALRPAVGRLNPLARPRTTGPIPSANRADHSPARAV